MLKNIFLLIAKTFTPHPCPASAIRARTRRRSFTMFRRAEAYGEAFLNDAKIRIYFVFPKKKAKKYAP